MTFLQNLFLIFLPWISPLVRAVLKFYESLSDGDVLTNHVLVISGQTLKETAIKRPVQKHDWFTVTL